MTTERRTKCRRWEIHADGWIRIRDGNKDAARKTASAYANRMAVPLRRDWDVKIIVQPEAQAPDELMSWEIRTRPKKVKR